MLTLTTLAVALTPLTVDERPGTIVEVAAAAGQFDTLLAAAEAAGLVDALTAHDELTVFAPTDEAFSKLPHGTVAALLKEENREALRTLLTYHVVPGRLDGAAVSARRGLDSLAGPRLDVSVDGDALRIDSSRVVTADVGATNGVIHVIDSVLMPPSDDLVELAQGAGNFGTLLAAAQAAGLAEALSGDGPFTVLAPTDEAFAALGDDTIAELLKPESRARLAAILKLHVIPGRTFVADALSGQALKTLNGQSVGFALDGGQLTVGGANVVAADLEASNGVVHAIDRVLVPAAPKGRLVFGFYSEAPSAEVAEYLGIDGHATRIVTSVTKESNAQRDGLQAKDIIVAIGGEPVTSKSIREAKERAGFGRSVAFSILRRGEPLELQIEVGVEPH